MTNYKTTSLKTQIKTLRQVRTDLTSQRTQAEGEIAALETRVEAGRSHALQHQPHKDPAALRELGEAKSRCEALGSQLREVERELARREAQAEAAEVTARCAAGIADLNAQIAAQQAEADTHTKRAGELETQHAAAVAAAEAAKEAEAAALVAGEAVDAGAREHAHRADVLSRAVEQAHAKAAAAQAQIADPRARRQQLQDEADQAGIHVAEAAMPGAWAEFLPHLHRLLTAQRKAYGYGAMSMPDLESAYREWREAQAAEE